MSELQVPYSVNEDAKQRTEWLDKRIQLASGEKKYVEFQIKEAVTRALREANGVITDEKQCNLPVVSPSNLTIKCLPFAVKELESEYYLEQYDINKDTIISINSLPDNDEDVLVYYWG